MWIAVLGFLFALTIAEAAPRQPIDSERSSFPNLASLLLQSELGMTYDHIQVYPTNEYRPAVHRLLQVAANVHFAASTPEPVLPAIFKPVFRREGDAIFISGYEQVTGTAQNYLSPPRHLDDPTDREALRPDDNVFGIPWIIAARKGLPNFNELALDTTFEISRILQMRKPAINQPPSETNQLFLISLSSAVGVEAWNSYRNTFDRAVDIYCTNRVEVGLTLLNQPGNTGTNVQFTQFITPANGVFPIPTWSGTGTGGGVIPVRQSFAAIIATNSTLLTNGLFKADGILSTQLVATLDWTTTNQFPIPEIWISITNSMQFAMVDRETQRMLDYVHLRVGYETNFSDLLTDPSGERGYEGLWITNRLGGDESSASNPPFGVIEQIYVALGYYGIPGNRWRDYGLGNPTGQAADKAIGSFRSFVWGYPMPFPPYNRNTNLVERVPFIVSKRFHTSDNWQANDPLIHQTDWELKVQKSRLESIAVHLSTLPQTLINIGLLNTRYEPWGGNPATTVSTGFAGTRRYDLRFKDPLVHSSDGWDFSEGSSLTPQSLGNIHRGTPWQTLYCKADELTRTLANIRSWREWTGYASPADWIETLPQSDWDVVALLVQYLWPEKPNKLLSVNDIRQHQWLKTLDGIVALTNTVPDEKWINYDPTTQLTFEPWTISWKSEQAQQIVDGIESDRSQSPNGYFENLGDIFQVEELSTQSPFLNLSDAQRTSGISDEAYETVALQLLARLRPDSVGHYTNKNGKPHLRFSGIEGCLYRIETSTDLIHWNSVKTATTTYGCIEFEPPVNSGEPQCFYRSVLLY